MLSHQRAGDLRDTYRQVSCPFRGCPAYGVELTDGKGNPLEGTFLAQEGRTETPPITSIVYGVPRGSDLGTYKEFTHIYLPAPTEYLVPHRSWILLRHQGVIRYAKRVLWATYNEKPRRSDDPDYKSNTGTRFMRAGHEVAVGPAVSIRRAFPWIDQRYVSGLVPGSILDPHGGEPFHWQLAMVVPTSDLRRRNARPFTIIRRSDLTVPVASSRAERTLRDNLAHNGVGVCKHLRSIRLAEKSVAPDIAIPELRTIVEYDGAYWHHGMTTHRKDIEKSAALVDAGWRVIRVRETGLEPLKYKRRKFHQFGMPPAMTSQELVRRVMALIPDWRTRSNCQ